MNFDYFRAELWEEKQAKSLKVRWHPVESQALSGDGVHVYVADSGILTSHINFEGRAIHGSPLFGTHYTP